LTVTLYFIEALSAFPPTPRIPIQAAHRPDPNPILPPGRRGALDRSRGSYISGGDGYTRTGYPTALLILPAVVSGTHYGLLTHPS